MNNDLITRYDALNNTAEMPADYCIQLERLAADFEADGRMSMAAKCRERAAHYRPVIMSAHALECGGDTVLYVTVAR